MPMNIERITELRRELESLGAVVVIWTTEDMPGKTEEEKEDQLNKVGDALENISIERGWEVIGDILSRTP